MALSVVETQERKRASYRALKHAALAAYSPGGSPRCECCAEDIETFLALDHRNEDGAAHRQRMTGTRAAGAVMYRWLQRHGWPQDMGIRVLCGNCNQAVAGGRTCPHQRPLQHALTGGQFSRSIV